MSTTNLLDKARRCVSLGVTAAILMAAQPGIAQSTGKSKAVPPPDLKWSLMPMVAFDYGPGKYKGTPEQTKILRAIWSDVLKSMPYIDAEGRKYPSFVIYSAPIDAGDSTVVFTSLSAASAAYGKCEDSARPNLYSTCPMVMVKQNKTTGKATLTEFKNFCHLHYEDPPGQTVANNHVALGHDASTGRVYFRVIQYGKHVPECDRVVSVR